MPTKGFGIGSLGFGRSGPLPGGNIKASGAIIKGVQSTPAGSSVPYVFQASCPLSDSFRVTGSIYFNIPNDGAFADLICISAASGNDGGFYVSAVTGNPGDLTIYTSPIYAGPGSRTQLYWDQTNGAVNQVAAGQWHNFAFALDISGPVGHDGSGNPIPPIGQFFLDGAPLSTGDFGAGATLTWFVSPDVWGSPTTGDIGINGKAVGLPDLPAGTYFYGDLGSGGPVQMALYQIWMGKFIDLTASSGTGSIFDPTKTSQPTGGSGSLDPVLMGELVLALTAAGIDPTFGLTVANIECAYIPLINNNASRGGLFDFTAVDINTAFAAMGQTPDQFGFTGSNNQVKAFVYYNFNEWVPTATQQFPSGDPTGIAAYTVYNQGVAGAQWIWNNTTSLINSSPYKSGMLNQTWAKNGRWGNLRLDPAVNTAQDWLNNLTYVWGLASTDAASRLMSVANRNINAFITQTGLPVPPGTAAQLFGIPDFQFNGDNTANGFQKNNGLDGNFTLFNGPLVNVTGPP